MFDCLVVRSPYFLIDVSKTEGSFVEKVNVTLEKNSVKKYFHIQWSPKLFFLKLKFLLVQLYLRKFHFQWLKNMSLKRAFAYIVGLVKIFLLKFDHLIYVEKYVTIGFHRLFPKFSQTIIVKFFFSPDVILVVEYCDLDKLFVYFLKSSDVFLSAKLLEMKGIILVAIDQILK